MKNITSHSFFIDSPLSIQLYELDSFIEETMRDLIKAHKNAMDKDLKSKKLNPLVTSNNQFISNVERFTDKIDNEVLKLNKELIWKNIQYIMSHDFNIIQNFILEYNEEMNRLFDKVKDRSIGNVYDFIRENEYEVVAPQCKSYLASAKKKYIQSYKNSSTFIKKMLV